MYGVLWGVYSHSKIQRKLKKRHINDYHNPINLRRALFNEKQSEIIYA